MRPRAVALIAASVVSFSVDARAAGELRYGVRVEGGGEYDSNPARQERVDGSASGTDITAAAALRLVSALDLALLTGGGHLFSLSVEGAGKRFLDPVAEGEDLVILDGRFAADFALTARNRLALQLAHYDAFQRAAALPEARDFRSTAPGLRFEHRRERVRLAAGGGWRWFVFKPESSFDFQAPTGFLAYRQAAGPALGEPGAEWDWGITASFEARRFRARRCLAGAPCPPTMPAERRQDRFVALGADVNRTGEFLLGGGTSVQLNDSNSYGEGLVRAAVHLRAVLLLPWQLSLAGRAELVATRYADAVQVGRDTAGAFLSIEEEGRSTARLELLRPIGERLEAGVRYTFWTSALGTRTVHYQRHNAIAFVAFLLGN